jgi:hypothetical protein
VDMPGKEPSLVTVGPASISLSRSAKSTASPWTSNFMAMKNLACTGRLPFLQVRCFNSGNGPQRMADKIPFTGAELERIINDCDLPPSPRSASASSQEVWQ